MITISQAAHRSGHPSATIKLWCRQGLIKGAYKPGQRLWLLPDDWKVPTPKRGPRFKQDRK